MVVVGGSVHGGPIALAVLKCAYIREYGVRDSDRSRNR